MTSAVTRPCSLATWAKTVGSDIQKEIPIERVTECQQVGRQDRGNDNCQQLSLHLDPCHVLGKVSGVVFACDDSIACVWEGRGGQNRSRDKGSRGVDMKGEGVVLKLSLNKEEATRRELGAKLSCSDFKDISLLSRGCSGHGSHTEDQG